MSVDKFGRHSKVNRTSSAVKGPKGDGYSFTEDGNYDIESKRLCNVGNAVQLQDAVNSQMLNDKFSEINTINSQTTQQIRDNVTDVLTRFSAHFDSKINVITTDVNKLISNFSFTAGYVSLNGKKRIVGVNHSIDKNDVVTRLELDRVSKKCNKIDEEIKNIVLNFKHEYDEFLLKYNLEIKNITELLIHLKSFKEETKLEMGTLAASLNSLISIVNHGRASQSE